MRRQNLSEGQLSMFIPARELLSYEPNPHDVAMYNEHDERMAAWAGSGSSSGSSSSESSESYSIGRDEFWDRKHDEKPELYESVLRQGVKEPVHVWHGSVGHDLHSGSPEAKTIAQGHHRVVYADNVDPTSEVPVRHFDASTHSFGEAVNYFPERDRLYLGPRR